MNFEGLDYVKSPRKATVWVKPKVGEDKVAARDIRISDVAAKADLENTPAEVDGAILHSRPRSSCGSGSSNQEGGEQPEKAADLRPLGERAEHAAHFYHAGEQRDPVGAAEGGRSANQSHPQNEEREPNGAAQDGRAADEPHPADGLCHHGGLADDERDVGQGQLDDTDFLVDRCAQ